MNKFWLTVLAVIAGILVVSNLGAMIGMAISCLIAFAGFHQYQKSESSGLKVFWGAVLIIGLLSAVSNAAAFIGLLSALLLYYVWRQWDKPVKNKDVIPSGDPFADFERQWDNITK